MTDTDTAPSRGRPRAFDTDATLRAALAQFWVHGYAQTSLDALTRAMGIRKSSFYAAYGSKAALFHAALQLYADESWARLRTRIAAAPTCRAARAAAMAELADVDGGPQGCFFANSMAEHGRHGPRLDALLDRHMARIEGAIAPLMPGPDAALQARSMVAQILGLIALRKTGVAPDALQAVIDSYLAGIG